MPQPGLAGGSGGDPVCWRYNILQAVACSLAVWGQEAGFMSVLFFSNKKCPPSRGDSTGIFGHKKVGN